MARRLVSLASVLVLVVSGWFGLRWWEVNSPDSAARTALAEEKVRSAQLQQRLESEQQRAEAFNQLIKRLTASKRVAQMVVLDQSPDADGKVLTKLHFSEVSRSGKLIEHPAMSVEGTGVHVDGYIVQFDDELVARNDPVRGHSLILFHRVFGHAKGGVESAYSLDTAGEQPAFYDGADPKLAALEKDLWKDFWKLAADRAYAEKYKVKSAWGGSVYADQLKVGQVYDLTLDPQGGLRMTLQRPGQGTPQ